MARRAKHWTWTLNNPTDDEEQRLGDAAEAGGVVYLCYGRETGENGTPHLQGYTVFESPIRFTTVKNRLGSSRLHIEISRGSPVQNRDYCRKDGDFEEFGTLPEGNQGRRTDLESFFEWADNASKEKGRPVTTPEAAREHPTILAKFPRVMGVARLRFEHEESEAAEWKPWQAELADRLEQPADTRVVEFIVDYEGGKGKSFFVNEWMDKHRDTAQFLSVGRRDDIAHVVKETSTVFLVDVPRGQMEYLRQEVLEQLKNKIVFSPKYNSRTKYLHKVPHVIVFCNEDPEETMSADRYQITHI